MPFLPFILIWSTTIMVTWLGTRFYIRWSYQKHITAHVGDVCQIELEERDACIKALTQELEQVREQNKQLRISNRAARILNRKVEDVLNGISGK